MTSQMATKLLQKVLTNPSQIASSLDWKQVSGATILSMTLHSDKIGLAIASHPSVAAEANLPQRHNSLFDDRRHSNNSEDDVPLRTLPSIPLVGSKRSELPSQSVDYMKELMDEYNVCGVVLSWPVQQDTARMGAACGRVLHTLDQLLIQASDDDDSTSELFSASKRPVCLWTSVPVANAKNTEDSWGRCPAYAVTGNASTEEGIHSANTDQYHQDQNIVAAQVWNDFCRTHWPQLYQYIPEPEAHEDNYDDLESTWMAFHGDRWDDNSSYVNAAAL